ncbi:MAG: twin-arginine translocation signal domain-containing protein, partial [Solirubrobacteraceae bacterium]
MTEPEMTTPDPEANPPDRRMTRRRFLQTAAGGAVVLGGAGFGVS